MAKSKSIVDKTNDFIDWAFRDSVNKKVAKVSNSVSKNISAPLNNAISSINKKFDQALRAPINKKVASANKVISKTIVKPVNAKVASVAKKVDKKVSAPIRNAVYGKPKAVAKAPAKAPAKKAVTPKKTVTAPSSNTSIEQKARDVMSGKYGNGAARKQALGADYDKVQAIINKNATSSKAKVTPAKVTPKVTPAETITIQAPPEKMEIRKPELIPYTGPKELAGKTSKAAYQGSGLGAMERAEKDFETNFKKGGVVKKQKGGIFTPDGRIKSSRTRNIDLTGRGSQADVSRTNRKGDVITKSITTRQGYVPTAEKTKTVTNKSGDVVSKKSNSMDYNKALKKTDRVAKNTGRNANDTWAYKKGGAIKKPLRKAQDGMEGPYAAKEEVLYSGPFTERQTKSLNKKYPSTVTPKGSDPWYNTKNYLTSKMNVGEDPVGAEKTGREDYEKFLRTNNKINFKKGGIIKSKIKQTMATRKRMYQDGGATSFKDKKKALKQEMKLARLTAKTERIKAGTEPTFYEKASNITKNVADTAGSAAEIVKAVKDRTGGTGAGSSPGGMRRGGGVKRMAAGGAMGPGPIKKARSFVKKISRKLSIPSAPNKRFAQMGGTKKMQKGGSAEYWWEDAAKKAAKGVKKRSISSIKEVEAGMRSVARPVIKTVKKAAAAPKKVDDALEKRYPNYTKKGSFYDGLKSGVKSVLGYKTGGMVNANARVAASKVAKGRVGGTSVAPKKATPGRK